MNEKLLIISPSDSGVRALAARHYSTKASNPRSWWPPGKTLCLTNESRTILFAWQWPKAGLRRDKQNGYNCILFRNEDSRLSSDVILEAEQIAIATWGENRAFTYVDPMAIQSTNAGYCYIKAGWQRIGVSKSGKILLEKQLKISPKAV